MDDWVVIVSGWSIALTIDGGGGLAVVAARVVGLVVVVCAAITAERPGTGWWLRQIHR